MHLPAIKSCGSKLTENSTPLRGSPMFLKESSMSTPIVSSIISEIFPSFLVIAKCSLLESSIALIDCNKDAAAAIKATFFMKNFISNIATSENQQYIAAFALIKNSHRTDASRGLGLHAKIGCPKSRHLRLNGDFRRNTPKYWARQGCDGVNLSFMAIGYLSSLIPNFAP